MTVGTALVSKARHKYFNTGHIGRNARSACNKRYNRQRASFYTEKIYVEEKKNDSGYMFIKDKRSGKHFIPALEVEEKKRGKFRLSDPEWLRFKMYTAAEVMIMIITGLI